MIEAAIVSFVGLIGSLVVMYSHDKPYRSVGEYVAVAVFATATIALIIGALL